MRIAIIGAGSVGATLGRAWIKHGEDVIWGLRNPTDPKHAALPKERVKAPAEAVKEAEVVVIATPWSAAEAAIKSLGSLASIDKRCKTEEEWRALIKPFMED